MNSNDGEHGGYKEIIFRVTGENAYGNLKFESGGHRVQRVLKPNPRAVFTLQPVLSRCWRKSEAELTNCGYQRRICALPSVHRGRWSAR